MPISPFPAPVVGLNHTSNGILYVSDGVIWLPDESGDAAVRLPNWTTATSYRKRDMVVDPANPDDVYIALNNYVSDASIAVDVANLNLDLISN